MSQALLFILNMSQIIPSQYLLITKTLDLQGYLKYQHFSPPLHRYVKLTTQHNEKKAIRTGRALKRSQAQRKTRLMNIGLCNLVLCTDGFVKFYTFTTKDSYFDRKVFTRLFTDFIRRLERFLGFKVIYIAVPEQHDSEATLESRRYSYHFHCLFFNLPYQSNRQIEDIWRLGMIKIKAIPINDGYMGLCYVLKYITKENMLNERISMPRGIIRPVVHYNLSEPRLIPIYKHATFISEADVTITTALYKQIKQ